MLAATPIDGWWSDMATAVAASINKSTAAKPKTPTPTPTSTTSKPWYTDWRYIAGIGVVSVVGAFLIARR